MRFKAGSPAGRRPRARLGLALTCAGLFAGANVPVTHAANLEGVPSFNHVFVMVLENSDIVTTWRTQGTYLYDLVPTGAFASQYYGTSHVSADNYIAMTSGQTPSPLFNTDCLDWSRCEQWQASRPDGGVSIADQLDGARLPWKAYMDEMGTPCLHPDADPLTSPYNADPYQAGYATRHNPFVYYPPVVSDGARCASHVVDYTQLATDLLSESTTPAYSFITPDTCHDGHDSPCVGSDHWGPGGLAGGMVAANDWMSVEVPKILRSPAFTTPGVSSVLFITTDESADTDLTGCTSGPLLSQTVPGTCASGVPSAGVNGGGLVGLLAIGSPAAEVRAGTSTSRSYGHDSLLRTVEDGLGLGSITPPSGSIAVFQDAAGHLNEAGSPLEHSMATLFNAGG
ncbi:MAG: alkaline phosphatase family protein [Candidatus Dormibacteria bacterium]